MKITKYEHACFTVELNGEILIIDPGVFAKSLEVPENVTAVVITHEHEDHFDPDNLAKIFDKNPDSILVSLGAIVKKKMPDHKSQAVTPGDKIILGAFNLEFFGGKHAEIHSSIPLADNIGVMVNETLYYPGDSFVEPHRPVDTLALPASGPWFKTSEAIDFALAVKPRRVFTTHDIHNSGEAKALLARIAGGILEKNDIEYISTTPGDSIEA